MDMAVANLFKREIRLTFDREVTEIYEPMTYRRMRYYSSPTIENVESVDASLLKPFVLYALSKVVYEDRAIKMDTIKIKVGINDLREYEDYVIERYKFDNPMASPELFFTRAKEYIRPFPNRLLNRPFQVNAYVTCYYICSNQRQEVRFRRAFNYYAYWQYRYPIEDYPDDESMDDEIPDEESYDSESTDEEEEYTPPIETYRQDCCVVCLEAKPNILYFDCMHIAICDSCDRVKRTARARKNCDVCRAEISRRIKI